jgi:heme exporter protein C
MKTILAWLLWLWMCLVIIGAFFYAPMAQGFAKGQSSRILFFHVPTAWVALLAFLAAAVWSARYLYGGRRPEHDRAAEVAIQLGLVFGVLATLTGALWARVEWGTYWNWDPRQTSIILSLVFYAAYLALRSAIEDPQTKGRLSAVYALLGVVVTPFFFFIVPRITFSLHPDPVVNAGGKVEMEARMQYVLYASTLGFIALFFWMHNLQCRLQALADRKSAHLYE